MDFKWYTLATYSGSEVKISEEINKLANENENIKEAFVPMKKVFKVVRGKKVEANQKIFPNYIFVRMIANRSTIDLIRTMPQVMGFLGGNPLRPESVPDENINKMKRDAEKDVAVEEERFEIGETVKIKDGHFESFTGIIEGKDEAKNILKISISIFGRSTIMDIDSSKVEKV
jgi:transcriptional antiterminator NusG